MADDTADTPIMDAALNAAAEYVSSGSLNAPTAAMRLRALEDERFGKDAVRINGMIERGYGSPYQMAAPEIRKQHIALTKLIEAEKKRDDAKGSLAQAEADYASAEKACDAAPE